MSRRPHEVVNRHRTRVASFVAGAVMLVTVTVGVLPGSAASYRWAGESAFCKTLTSFHATAPTPGNSAPYKAWIKTYLPFYEKLASEAPSGTTRTAFSEIVTILKYEEGSNSLSKLDAYIAANHAKWTLAWKDFAKDIMGCVTSLYG